MASSSAADDSWRSNPYEIEMQIRLIRNSGIKGASIYSLSISNPKLVSIRTRIARMICGIRKVLRPILGLLHVIHLEKQMQVLKGNKNILTWDNIPGARGYVIYRSTGKINFDDSSQIYQILGVDTSEFPVFEDIVEVGKT